MEIAVVIVRVHCSGRAHLSQVGLAQNGLCLFFHLCQCRHQYRHQQRNNGYHYQKLYQGKTSLAPHDNNPYACCEKNKLFKKHNSCPGVLPYNRLRFKGLIGKIFCCNSYYFVFICSIRVSSGINSWAVTCFSRPSTNITSYLPSGSLRCISTAPLSFGSSQSPYHTTSSPC